MGHLRLNSAFGREFSNETGIDTTVVRAAFFSLYKPRLRRILDIRLSTLYRVTIAFRRWPLLATYFPTGRFKGVV